MSLACTSCSVLLRSSGNRSIALVFTINTSSQHVNNRVQPVAFASREFESKKGAWAEAETETELATRKYNLYGVLNSVCILWTRIHTKYQRIGTQHNM